MIAAHFDFADVDGASHGLKESIFVNVLFGAVFDDHEFFYANTASFSFSKLPSTGS